MTTNLGGHEREIAPLVTLSTSKEGKKGQDWSGKGQKKERAKKMPKICLKVSKGLRTGNCPICQPASKKGHFIKVLKGSQKENCSIIHLFNFEHNF